MSSQSSVDVEVRLRMKDGATAGIKAVSETAQQEAAKTATATEKAARKAADDVEKSTARQRSSYEKTSQARESLGVRSEKAIQKEIDNTRRAYSTLAAAGFASAQEQERAYAAVQSRITRLTNEMGKLTTAQKKAGEEARKLAQIEAEQARGQKVLRYGAAGVAGVGAAAYTLKAPVMSGMSYDERLAHMSNTAFSGQRDAAGRLMGAKTLESAIVKARRIGGGTREGAAEALDTMIASNAVEIEDALKILPTVIKQARGANADPNEIALTAVRAMQTFNIGADDLESVLSGTQVAGQMGSFELKNMAKWLPAQMSKAKQLGISGKDGLAKLAAWNEASAITAGTKDEAGNNLADLLNELNSPHFRKFMAEAYLANGQKVGKGQKDKRMKDIDSIYLDYANRGIDKVSATTEMMDTIFSRDKRFSELKGQLKGLDEKDPKRKEILESMAAQVQGVLTGKVFHNQQSLGALLGIMGNRDIVQKVQSGVLGQYAIPADRRDELESRISHQTISATAAYKAESAREEANAAQKSVLDSLTPAIGKAAEAFADLASKHPALVGTTTLATAALGALAGVAGMTAVAMGGKLPGTGAIVRAAEWAATSGVAKGAMRVAKVGGIAGIASTVGGYALEKGFGEDSAISRYGSSAMSGAAIGATVGSIVPVLGTGIGAALGGGLGLLYEGIKDALKPAEQKPLDVNAKMTVGLAPGLVLQGQSMQASGGNVQLNTGNVWTGAPG